MDAFETVTARVRERIAPDPDERERLEAATAALVDRAERAVAELPVSARVVRAGSTARNTWLAGDRDIDIFVCFSPDLDDGALEEYGIAVGTGVLPDGREEYAEHPYVSGTYEGFAVDLVPCYDVETAAEIRSSVDRTPFHTAYVGKRLNDGLADVRLDPADHGQATFDDPLVVIDPTDPERNVAAVLSAANLARFQHVVRELLADPRESLFEPPDHEPIDAAAVRTAFERRGTTPVAVRVTVPDLIDDQLWPQLERSRAGVAGLLARHGFDVFRDAVLAEDHDPDRDERIAVLLFELAVSERPAVERHEGPPVAARSHAERFYDTYIEDGDGHGPFVAGGRYVVEREREFVDAPALLEAEITEASHGARIQTALAKGYDLLVGEAIGELADRFDGELAAYLDPGVRRSR
ncbi:tRNA CCA-pyrophosphorylase [Halobacteriales archaeon QH_10_67_13]|nr:MAG: tRNA CCA-pyrophosphorylase [Halobacteriales archaeon QH_10_67_13]